MSDTIERVTLENAADQLKAKIRMAFVELLPEEQWKAMVTAELVRFTTQTSEPKYQGSNEYIKVPSDFSKICREVFGERVKDEIRKTLASGEFASGWGLDGKKQISDAINSWLTENSAALIQSTVQALAAQAAQNLVSSMAAMR